MTDDQSRRLDEVLDKLNKTAETLGRLSDNLSRGSAVTSTSAPVEGGEQIIRMLAPMAENIEAIRKELREMEPGKIAPESPSE